MDMDKSKRIIVNVDVYPVRLILTDFCGRKWTISSSSILAIATAMPALASSIWSIFSFTSNRPNLPAPMLRQAGQNLPGI